VPFEPSGIAPRNVGDGISNLKRDYGYGARYILKKSKFHPENVIAFFGNNATKENFKESMLEISRKADENDIVYIELAGHGNTAVFAFNDGMGGDGGEEGGGGTQVAYEEIDNLFDEINAKHLVVSLASCYAGTPEVMNATKRRTNTNSCHRLVFIF